MTCLLILCIWGHGLQVNGSEVTLKGSESAWVHLQRCAYTWALGKEMAGTMDRRICNFDMTSGEYISTDIYVLDNVR
ncbi:hypothetical protein N7516_004331 [Penicillium verrucosum]|uniref:uncharacterized protein n=1 Tax=Penicillium verrucosum TaxID=60171 RepID=UPI0025454D08|nr:uncharacterized protein N7516_004331 [Penicillium verrucosum]KAJ5944163.1 hypothetical protein N7516_004331 [Penicillium verrucosum]